MSKMNGEMLDLIDEAAELLKKADEGDAEAQFYFGYYLLHESDREYRKDLTEEQIDRAFYYYKQSAMTGCMQGSAALEIADAYDLGEIVPQDYKKARMWYNTALLSENPPAACMLGDYALKGYDCEIDYEKAARYYLKASPKFIDAVYRLGDMFLNGQFFNRDQGFARSLYQYVVEDEERLFEKYGFHSQAHSEALERLDRLNQMEDPDADSVPASQTGTQAEIRDKILEILEEGRKG